MRRLALLLLAPLAALAALAAPATPATPATPAAPRPNPPTEITAEYKLTADAIPVGRVRESFVRKGDAYTLRSVTQSEGVLKVFLDDSVTLTSTGRVVAGGLQPLAFSQRRKSTDKGSIEATFDWDRKVMHSVAGDNVKDVPLPPGTQDRISILYQFMFLAAGSEVVTLPMSNGKKVEYYTYRFVDDVRLQTPAGTFDTLHYARVAAPGESEAQVWLAKERFHYPIRVVFDDHKGLRLEQNLVSLQYH